MKKITILLFTVLSTMAVNAQTTFDLDWEQGVNGALASFTIEVGDAVRWTWANTVPHSVTSLGGSTETFDSGILTGMGTQFTYTFTVVGINDYDCVVHPATMFGRITVEPVLSVQDKFVRNLKFYPNPVNDEMTIASLYQFDTYEIFDITGKKVGHGLGEGTFTTLNVSYLTTGTYFMKVTAGDLQTTIKLVKQ